MLFWSSMSLLNFCQFFLHILRNRYQNFQLSLCKSLYASLILFILFHVFWRFIRPKYIFKYFVFFIKQLIYHQCIHDNIFCLEVYLFYINVDNHHYAYSLHGISFLYHFTLNYIFIFKVYLLWLAYSKVSFLCILRNSAFN